MDDGPSFRSARGPQPVGDFSVDLRGAQGVLVGHGRQHNVFNLNIPRGIRNAVLIFIIATLLAGGGWIAVTWMLPQFAPTYKTQFLIDTTAGSVSDGPETRRKRRYWAPTERYQSMLKAVVDSTFWQPINKPPGCAHSGFPTMAANAQAARMV